MLHRSRQVQVLAHVVTQVSADVLQVYMRNESGSYCNLQVHFFTEQGLTQSRRPSCASRQVGTQLNRTTRAPHLEPPLSIRSSAHRWHLCIISEPVVRGAKSARLTERWLCACTCMADWTSVGTRLRACSCSVCECAKSIWDIDSVDCVDA